MGRSIRTQYDTTIADIIAFLILLLLYFICDQVPSNKIRACTLYLYMYEKKNEIVTDTFLHVIPIRGPTHNTRVQRYVIILCNIHTHTHL